jgi:hypothetical protein
MAPASKKIRDRIDALERALEKRPRARKLIGAVLILIGTLALLTPATPGSWLILVGLWILGARFGRWWRWLKNLRFVGALFRWTERGGLYLARLAVAGWRWVRNLVLCVFGRRKGGD